MTYGRWHIERLRFTGRNNKESILGFDDGLSLVYGASNTGKSFALKALDFMLGGQRELPSIRERDPYSKVWLDVAFSLDDRVSLERAIAGGAFKLHSGDVERVLAPRHDANSPNNISSFLLMKMGASGRKVSLDASGTHGNLTFRDIAPLVLTNEISIQSENSPAESGDRGDQTRERNVLKFLLTGEDDGAIVPVVKPKDFRTGRAAKAAVLQDMIDQLNADISEKYRDPDGLGEQDTKLTESLQEIETELSTARTSIRSLLDEKRRLSNEISLAERRAVELSLSLESFSQLREVYVSDVSRLQAIEEAGFLLGISGKDECPVCGAPAAAQSHSHELAHIEDVRLAAEVEIRKIEQQREELERTVADTEIEGERLARSIRQQRDELSAVERKLENATPAADMQQRRLSDILPVRDYVRHGLNLIDQRDRLVAQKETISASRPPKRDTTIQFGLSTETAKDFSDTISDVLLAWGFPGQKHVVFDLNTYDLIIDGKERRNNGKGVRAITHAAFKVALMLFCRERSLPHPGFLVLDTPLLTYRDPMKKAGDSLELDEQELRNTDLKERFFDHLASLKQHAQVVVFENVDPPKSLGDALHIETFTNDPDEGRQGLL
ncbi:hypothetical protein [Methylobacterium sp. D54C]